MKRIIACVMSFFSNLFFGKPAVTTAKTEKPAVAPVADYDLIDPLAEPPKPVKNPPARTPDNPMRLKRGVPKNRIPGTGIYRGYDGPVVRV